MYKILKKKVLADNINEYVVYAPAIAKHCLAGQFIILRVDDEGERVPFTICDYSREEGTVSILVQTVGYTTMRLAELDAGDYIHDFAGPLGNSTDLSDYKNIMLVGGGIGTAVVLPQAKQLFFEGKPARAIVGARNTSLLMYVDEMTAYCKTVDFMTDDGSNGNKGFVTDKLRSMLEKGEQFDAVFAVGPLGMMRAVCNLTKEYGVHTIVSMNSMMVDGTGMCGCCRLTVGNETKYACVDGPEFDGHLIDFDEAIYRSRVYYAQEKEHVCKLRG
ncbi:MAG TPA: sulfide/dihydroorotate dehydrogenase-like FAD/NAD-binding protein [Clostridia bacterium]|nr:sulfide/dihydroorotate dehydrogenase-like FAD/NAD-binding protein [Clostridia bacterium]